MLTTGEIWFVVEVDGWVQCSLTAQWPKHLEAVLFSQTNFSHIWNDHFHSISSKIIQEESPANSNLLCYPVHRIDVKALAALEVSFYSTRQGILPTSLRHVAYHKMSSAFLGDYIVALSENFTLTRLSRCPLCRSWAQLICNPANSGTFS